HPPQRHPLHRRLHLRMGEPPPRHGRRRLGLLGTPRPGAPAMTRHAPTTPRRIQRRRAKGWRMPDGAIYVGRPTKWGNATRPVEATRAGHQWAVEQYAVDLWEHRLPVTPADARRELAGRDL